MASPTWEVTCALCQSRLLSDFDGLLLHDWNEDVRASLKSKKLIDFLDKTHEPIPEGLFNLKKPEEQRKYIEQVRK